MTITTSNHAELLWPGIKSLFGQAYNEYKPLYKQFLDTQKSNKSFEKHQGVTTTGLAAVKDQGGQLTYADTYQGFQKEVINVTYALGATVTQEMMEDDQYDYINRIPEFLARSMRATEETVAANLLNNGFSTATIPSTTADGVSLFSRNHLLVASASTLANTPTTQADLVMTSLEQAYIDISGYVDDHGLPIVVMPKALVVPRDLQFQARKLLETEYAVGSTNNDVNVVSTANMPVQLVWNPYLTDSDAWFIKTDAKDGLVFQERIAATPDRDNDFDTKNLRFSIRSRFAVFAADPRGSYGSAGA